MDKKAGKYFIGDVEMYNEVYFVNTLTGEGVDRVLKKIDPLLCKMASKSYMPGYSFEDIKQELAIIAIEGIKSYDCNKKVKLSTFLHTHLRNKFISKLKSKNKISNDAHLVKEGSSKSGGPKIRKARSELQFSQCVASRQSDGSEIPFEYSLGESDGLYNVSKRSYDDVNFEISINKVIKRLDPKTAKIVSLVCFEDYTIKDAAREVGLSDWAASMRIKKLVKRPQVRSALGR